MEANQAVSSTCRSQQSMGFPPPQRKEPLPCPRCDSRATKFCYYNNYNLSQPRYLCKSCRRYWTHGGTLRNVPVGGATRKISKKSRTASSCSVPSTTTAQPSSSANPQLHMNSPPSLTLNSEPCLGLNGFSYEFAPDFDHGDVGNFPELSALPSDYNAWDDLALPHHPPNNLD